MELLMNKLSPVRSPTVGFLQVVHQPPSITVKIPNILKELETSKLKKILRSYHLVDTAQHFPTNINTTAWIIQRFVYK